MDEFIPEEKVAGAETRDLQVLLKAAVQHVEWTYSIFWHFCPQERELVWGNGYYNGAIKTRKTTQPGEATAKDAALERTHQLKELYETLLAGESTSESRVCTTALSPEDLTETEWFYLISFSFSFPPSSGIPRKAYARRKHVWLSGANEVDSKIFSRAILATNAKIQTVVCIPMLDGVVELGTTKQVKEDVGFVELVKSFFIDPSISSPKPSLSEYSNYEAPEEYREEEVEEEMTMSDEIMFSSPDFDAIFNQNLPPDLHTESSNHTLDTNMEEGGNYSQTVTTILMSQPTSLYSDSLSTSSHRQASFATWNGENIKEYKNIQRVREESSSQRMHKDMIRFLHNNKDNKLQYPNHVESERRRRDKLNEKFKTLRSILPSMTKGDKISTLEDTIEYVNHLRKRVDELETTYNEQQHKRRHICKGKISEEVEVSIIESDVLLEMRCEYRDGLLLDVLHVLQELGIETTGVQTAVNDHEFEAEVRAKVRGIKPSITEVKRNINQVILNTNLYIDPSFIEANSSL